MVRADEAHDQHRYRPRGRSSAGVPGLRCPLSQEIALHQAHTATDAAVQRVAVADWLYWQYVTGLLDRALAAAS